MQETNVGRQKRFVSREELIKYLKRGNEMTTEQAIHKIEFMRNGYEKLLTEKVKEGFFIADGVSGEWRAEEPLEEPLFDAYKEHIEACGMAIDAMIEQKYKIETEEVTRCKDCVFMRTKIPPNRRWDWCSKMAMRVKEDDYCSFAERVGD